MAKQNPTSSNDLVEQQLHERLTDIEAELDADALTWNGRILFGAETHIRKAIESIDNKRQKLVVILETFGGYIEIVQRIVIILRHHYPHAEFIIPNYAYSAGTVLVLSGDAIHMNYYSVLGPIDPQVPRSGSDGHDLVPALGYLVQYERLIKKSKEKKLTTAELALLVQKFDLAELYRFEQERELTISLLKDWLVKYKFKKWMRTRSRKLKVTPAMKAKRASKIARLLNNTERWHSHGTGITMEVLIRDVGLEIEDFGEKKSLNSKVNAYCDLLSDYRMRLGLEWTVQTRNISIPHRD